ncbi:MAG: aspartate--ammonia ligase [Bacteroidales bacterium]
MGLFLPKDYRPTIVPETMEQAIKLIKDRFESELANELCLRRVTAPLFVLSGTGLNDDLNGSERAVTFPVKHLGDKNAEVVHSLAKWKRAKLAAYKIAPGYGLYTDMNAIRADEELDNIHSLYVDQWDWERTITQDDRSLSFLKTIVDKLFTILKKVENTVYEKYPHITPILPERITYIHSEELLQIYPDLTPKQREYEITKRYGAVFLIGIGSDLSNGEPHDGRAPDYDDWTTYNEDGHQGLNGDILLWNPILENSFEISSMGIRVDKEALLKQLELRDALDRTTLSFHSKLLEDRIPLSIGGGIGQSRLCMYFLRCAHIGEVQSSIWGDDMIEECAAKNIYLK